jgi:putative ABC transport system permease protein
MTRGGTVAAQAFSSDLWPNVRMGLENLRAHTLRAVLTMLGMIFGVAAVVAMLSIGAGAQQQVMAFIEDLGVRNVIVQAREAQDEQTMQKWRERSPGLTFQDMRAIRANIQGIEAVSGRKRFVPSTLVPRPVGDMPVVYGVEPVYAGIARLRVVDGRALDPDDEALASPVCVVGEAVRAALFAGESPIGRHVKINEQWLRIVGVAGPQLTAQEGQDDVAADDRNNVIYTPLSTAMLRLEDARSRNKDEIDGIYLQLSDAERSAATSRVVRGLLTESHRGAPDFTVTVPAELLAQQRRTQRVFEIVMVAIASISLLVGGIGIMNIMLASVLERTREIGIRRAVGARQREVVAQFLVEATLISGAGGLIGVVVGIALSRLVGYFAEWTTIVSVPSVVLAFSVSVAVGLVFGVYPARKAARLDPVAALHYE